MRGSFVFVPLLAGTLAGCLRNACQRLCVDIANYAKDQCGLEFPKEQLKQCIEDHRSSQMDNAHETNAICRSEAPNLSDEWTCDDLAAYFHEGGSAGDTAGGGDTGAGRGSGR